MQKLLNNGVVREKVKEKVSGFGTFCKSLAAGKWRAQRYT